MTDNLSSFIPRVFIAIFPWIVVFFICPSNPARAQFTIAGDFDVRGEYINLHRIVADSMNSKSFNFPCSAKGEFGFKSKRTETYVSLEASWSDGSNLYTAENTATWSFNDYETWFRYHFTKNFSLQAGRIEISYQDEQFFQARDWDNLVTSHNAVIAHWLAPDTNYMTDLGFAMNRFKGDGADLNTNTIVNGYRYMGYIYAYRKFFSDKLHLSFTEIFDASDNGISRDILYGRNTIGFNSWLELSDWNLNLSGYYQSGHITDGRKLNAFYYSGYLSYGPLKWLNLMIAGEHMSGDDLADTLTWKKEVHGFSRLYGNTRKTLGASGIFNTTLRSNINPGLNNLYLKSTFNFTSDFSLELSYHWFSVPHGYITTLNPSTGSPALTKVTSTLLNEVDFLFTYNPVKPLTITLNYSSLLPGRSLTGYNGWNFRNSKFLSYAYLEVEYTPVLFISGKRKAKF